ncbi:SIR2 family NAD-dependent protein deacylase [Lysinibacillus sp. 54212]|uniref:SIR2 family NAD-dependent protein deacylase n=1 Tax=Lysinibacillus sp. 54212 TaxID=3119829 RepID=UPI002FC6C933
MIHGSLELLIEWLQHAKGTVVLTGAGMSTESGIPDFRSHTGWWRNIDPRIVATVDALEHNYDLFYDFYCMRLERLKNCKPHEGHYILASLEEQGLISSVATQNVDGFHKAAGSNKVYELHGNIHHIRCHECQQPSTINAFLAKENCSSCGGKLRPGIVLFGEFLPESAWAKALGSIQQADLVIVIGTSLEVYPVNQLPSMTNGRTVYINMEVDEYENEFDLIIQGSAKEVLQAIKERVDIAR